MKVAGEMISNTVRVKRFGAMEQRPTRVNS